MNQTLLTVLIDLAVPALALAVIGMESHWTAKVPAEEPDCLIIPLPHPTPAAIGPTRKTRLNSSFKTR